MAAYPSTYSFAPGSTIEQIEQKSMDLAVDGTIRSQIIAATPRYRLTIRHIGLTQAQVDTLRTFYVANAQDTTVAWPDGNDYFGALYGWSQQRDGYRSRVTLQLYGDRL